MRNKWLLYILAVVMIAVIIIGSALMATNVKNDLPSGKYHTQCFQNGGLVLDVISYGPAPEKSAVRMGTTMWAIVWYDENNEYQTFPFTGPLACRPEYLGPK